jgi:hypothetical protein
MRRIGAGKQSDLSDDDKKGDVSALTDNEIFAIFGAPQSTFLSPHVVQKMS